MNLFVHKRWCRVTKTFEHNHNSINVTLNVPMRSRVLVRGGEHFDVSSIRRPAPVLLTDLLVTDLHACCRQSYDRNTLTTNSEHARYAWSISLLCARACACVLKRLVFNPHHLNPPQQSCVGCFASSQPCSPFYPSVRITCLLSEARVSD